VGTSPRCRMVVGWSKFGWRQGGVAAGGRSLMVACYGLGESKLTTGMVVARNGGVGHPFIGPGVAGEGRSRREKWSAGEWVLNVVRF
jgi:hypothetical protein